VPVTRRRQDAPARDLARLRDRLPAGHERRRLVALAVVSERDP